MKIAREFEIKSGELRQSMIDWCLECLDDMFESYSDDIQEASDRQLAANIQRHYDRGIVGFILDGFDVDPNLVMAWDQDGRLLAIYDVA